MRWPGRTIWDTRIQGVCGIISARGSHGVEIFASASFAQVSLDPARVIINPNRMHSVEPAVRESGRFAINVMPLSLKDVVVSLMKLRRRQPGKADIVGLSMIEDGHQIPFAAEALRVVLCEVESSIPSGDRRLYVARVLESRPISKDVKDRPLLFSDLKGAASGPFPRRAIRRFMLLSGALDLAKTARYKMRPPPAANIALKTYEEAGATEEEIARILEPGIRDDSRHLSPAPPLVPMREALGICVVGTGWGGVHCRYLKMADPSTRLFVCGRNPEKTRRLAESVGAEGHFLKLEEAVADSRVQGLTLALPHDLHREAVEVVAAAGKHALLEKPIATTLEDADAIIRAAKRAATILMVAEDMHFRPAVREAVNNINRGAIGEPLYLLVHAGGLRKPQGWAADKDRMGGGVLIDIGIHYVRALRLLMGEPDRVFASKAMQINTRMLGEDSVQLIFSSRFGWQAHMLLTWSSQRGDIPDIVVAGDQGTLHLWPGKHYLDEYPVAPQLIPRLISYVRPYSLQEKLMRPRWQRRRLPLTHSDVTGYLGEMQEFLTAIAEGRSPVSPPEDARRDLEIVMCSYQALTEESWVAIPPLG